MRRVWIVKADGSRAWYNRAHLMKTCRRSGASHKACKEAINKVERVLRDGMHTKDILKAMLAELQQEAPYHAPKYDLKGAIMRLGPAGFHFEKLTGELLQHLGYATQTNPKLTGGCVTHEVDVVAIKNKKCYMVECKFHRSSGVYTGLKETMYTWARLEDLSQGYKNGTCDKFHQAWLITNTKFSDQSIKYANCKDVKLTGWNYPKGESYVNLLEDNNLYPITTLQMNRKTLSAFSRGNIMFLRDLIDLPDREILSRTGLSRQQLEKHRQLAHKILHS